MSSGAILAHDDRGVAPDLPGYGASPPGPPKITMRELADTVLGLMDAVEIERATIVGLSMGGLVAMELALAHPERLSGIVLVATTAAPVTPDEPRPAGPKQTRSSGTGCLPLHSR
jgi:pimeloyl-ACP methyl ester carboxylesterase